jgi:hypothetical protein
VFTWQQLQRLAMIPAAYHLAADPLTWQHVPRYLRAGIVYLVTALILIL